MGFPVSTICALARLCALFALHTPSAGTAAPISYISLGSYLAAVVENVAVRREPLPKMSGVYFIQPSSESIQRIIEDFDTSPLYKSAHVFFSSPAPPAVLAAIRGCPGLTSRLRSLKEVWHLLHEMLLHGTLLFSDAPATSSHSFDTRQMTDHRGVGLQMRHFVVHQGLAKLYVHQVEVAHCIRREVTASQNFDFWFLISRLSFVDR